ATYDARAALAVLEMAALDYVMIVSAYTLLSQEAAEELIPYCADRGIGVICASPFHSGILVRGPADGARYNYSSAGPQILAQV
ncbi:aldo/keto reductase, partial [Streptomyces turgidiscabies]|uniref:aldo/keto reductase n=1 Tax=Streptomyces turgidiscabies TaxID=85558 RepID=UPI0038F63994